MHKAVKDFIFPRIMRITTKKEAWEILGKVTQGFSKVRAMKFQSFRKEGENIKITENEGIKD